MKLYLSFLASWLLSASARESPQKNRVLVRFQRLRAADVDALVAAGAEKHFQFDEIETVVMSVPEQALRGLQNNPNVVVRV